MSENVRPYAMASAEDGRMGSRPQPAVPAARGAFEPAPGPDSLIASLPPEISNALFARAHPTLIKAGHVLFSAGEEGKGCYLLKDGLMKVTVNFSRAQERVLAVLPPGAVIGELSMIDGTPRSATVTAVKDCRLGYISRAQFEAFGEDHPALYRHLLRIVVRRLRDTNVAVAETTFLSLKGRVARALLSLAEAFGRDVGAGRIVIQHKITQGDVAAMAGIARENASRIMNEWLRAGTVTRIRDYYCIEDRVALVKIAQS